MKVIFFGTPKFSADILSYLFENKINVVACVTQSDIKKNERKYISDTKKVANVYLDKSDIYQPIKASDPEFINSLKKYDADLFIVVAYGQILKQELLDIPKKGCINVHASLLPQYRGAAPIQRSLINGDKKTGITIQKMVKKMDAGDIILQKEIEIPNDMNFYQLLEDLCMLAKPMLIEVIEKFKKNDIELIKQDETKVSFANKIQKEDRKIDFEKSAQEIYNQIRAFSSVPGAYLEVLINNTKKELKVFEAKVLDQKLEEKEILQSKNFFIIGTKDGSIEFVLVQLEGKKKIRGSEFLRGVQGSISIV